MMTSDERIARLEKLVVFLARGILAHEYSKDLDRDGIEHVLREIASNDLKMAAEFAEIEEYKE